MASRRMHGVEEDAWRRSETSGCSLGTRGCSLFSEARGCRLQAAGCKRRGTDHVRARRVRVQPVVGLHAPKRRELHQACRPGRVAHCVVSQGRARAQRLRTRRRGSSASLRRRRQRGGGAVGAGHLDLEQEVAHLLTVHLRRANAQPQPGGLGVGTRLQQRPQQKREQAEHRVRLARARLAVGHQRRAAAVRHLGRQGLYAPGRRRWWWRRRRWREEVAVVVVGGSGGGGDGGGGAAGTRLHPIVEHLLRARLAAKHPVKLEAALVVAAAAGRGAAQQDLTRQAVCVVLGHRGRRPRLRGTQRPQPAVDTDRAARLLGTQRCTQAECTRAACTGSQLEC